MRENRFLLLIAFLALLCYTVNLDAFEANLMEARNFVTANEMLVDGHWWETTMNGKARLEKPPLPTWITAIFGSLSSNISITILRLPAAFMGVLLVVWTYLLAKSYFENYKIAQWAGICTASSLLVIEMARTGTWDIFYVSFAIGSFAFLLKGLKANSIPSFLTGGILFGFSILSKGPVAGIMLLAFLSALFLNLEAKTLFMHWKGVMLFGVVAGIIGLSWPIYNFIYLSEATEAVIQKESITWTSKHVKPFYFYLIFPLFSGIWAIAALFSLIPSIAKKTIGKPYWSLIAWIGVTLFFFSLLPMKKERYLLPVIPILGMLLGSFVHGILQDKNSTSLKKISWTAFGISSIGLSLSPIALFFIPSNVSGLIEPFSNIGLLLLSATGIYATIQLYRKHYRHAILAVAISPLIICFFLMPQIAAIHYKNPSFISPSKLMKNQALKTNEIYGASEADMRVVFALGKKLLPIDQAQEAVKNGPVYAVIELNQHQLQEKFPNCIIERLDSSGHHITAKNYGIQAYKITLKQ